MSDNSIPAEKALLIGIHDAIDELIRNVIDLERRVSVLEAMKELVVTQTQAVAELQARVRRLELALSMMCKGDD